MRSEHRYYPVLLRLNGRRCLVVGGGAVAFRKVASLRQAGARVRVISPQFCAPLERIKGVARHRRRYRRSDLKGAALVISATDDSAVNRRVAREAMAAGVPVNVVDQPDLCSFIVPASFRRGRLTITVSTDGASPALSGMIRHQLAHLFGAEYSRLLDALAAARPEAMRRIANSQVRRQILRKLVSPEFLKLAKRSSARAVRQAMLALISAVARSATR